jgi:hypothetical protein
MAQQLAQQLAQQRQQQQQLTGSVAKLTMPWMAQRTRAWLQLLLPLLRQLLLSLLLLPRLQLLPRQSQPWQQQTMQVLRQPPTTQG